MKYLVMSAYISEDGRKWAAATRRYRAHLLRLLPGFTKSVRQFLQNEVLHDGTLVALSAGDVIATETSQLGSMRRNRRRMAVAIQALTFEQDLLYTLTLSGVHRFNVQYPTTDSQDPKSTAFGDWLYSEMTRGESGHFSFGVVFASGAEISVEFERFRVQKRRLHSKGPQFG